MSNIEITLSYRYYARPDDGPVTGPKHVVYKSNKYYSTIFSCVRLLLPLRHIMYTTGMLQLKIGPWIGVVVKALRY